MNIKVVNKSSNPLPRYATPLAAGLDLMADLDQDVTLAPMQRMLVPTGIFIELLEGFEAQVRPRSGLASKHGITVVNSPGTIDPDYRGEVKVPIINLSTEPFVLKSGERIAQLIVSRFERIEWQPVSSLSDTERGEGGFGHTGVK